MARFKYFKDKELKEPIDYVMIGPAYAGETKRYDCFVQNVTDGDMTKLKFTTGNKDVRVVEAPMDLGAKQSGRILLEWTPAFDIEEALETCIYMTGEVWFKPKRVVGINL